MGLKCLPKILRRVAYPIEPFGFKVVPNVLPPPLLDGNHDRLGKQPGLFDQLEDRQANEFQCVHNDMFIFLFLSSIVRPHLPQVSNAMSGPKASGGRTASYVSSMSTRSGVRETGEVARPTAAPLRRP
jgi:hypothetical protein